MKLICNVLTGGLFNYKYTDFTLIYIDFMANKLTLTL